MVEKVNLGSAPNANDGTPIRTSFERFNTLVDEIYTSSGSLATLTTTDKASIVGAINELDAEIGDIGTLTTTDKTSIVAAINEIVGRL